MAALEQVMQLKNQGVSDSDIINYLREQGISPKEITEALAQSKIKSELNREENYNPDNSTAPSEYSMQPSIMLQNQQNLQQIPSSYEPQTQDYQDYQYPVKNYPEYQQIEIETINEIIEQLIEEKNEKIQKQISILNKFKEEISLEIEQISKRLEKIENNFNNLQSSIIRRIGDYGEDIKNIAKEMHTTQESFSKMIRPLANKPKKNQEEISEAEISSKSKRTKKSPKFEDYLR